MDHPNDGLSFQELCAAIKRSDPAMTRVSARGFEGHVGRSRLLELGTILWNNGGGNSIEIDFHPRNISPETSQSAQVSAKSTSDDDSTAESHPLLLWIKQGAPSLTAVRLISESVTEVDVLERVMRALAGNPSICMFEAVDLEFPLPILTEYLTSAHAPSSLQTLKFEVNHHVTEYASKPEWQAPAQAIGALSKLEELELSGFSLSPMMYWWPTALSLPASLRRLTIKDESQWGPYKSFCDSWAALRHLEHVELHSLRIDDAEMWNVLESALQSTPSLSSLHLCRALFLDEAVRHFVSYMGSNDASRQHVRRLQLSYCVLRETTNGNPPRPVRPYYILGGMLCGSLLEHVSLDVATLHNVANFLHILTANASILRLQSLKLLDFNTANVLPSASEFVAVTAHLRCLILDFRSSDIEHNALRTFVTSLRSNASLNSVQLQCNGSTLDLDDRNARRIQSVTTRNRLLPELMKSAVPSNSASSVDMVHADANRNEPFSALLPPPPASRPPRALARAATASAALPPPKRPRAAEAAAASSTEPPLKRPRLFPTLCLGSMSTPGMAPSLVLIGALAAQQGLCPVHICEARASTGV